MVCALASEALGPENVAGITMPSAYSSSGSVDDFGDSAAAAASSLLAQLGVAGASVTPPLLDDLSRVTRALEAWNRGDLAASWRAVEGKLSPRAMRIREQLADAP